MMVLTFGAGLMVLTFGVYAGLFCAYWIVYLSVAVLQLTAWALFSLRLYFRVGVALAGTCAIIAFNRMLGCLCRCKSFLQSRSLADIEQV